MAPLLLGLWRGRTSWWETHGGEKLLISLQPGSKERKRGPNSSFKGTLPSDLTNFNYAPPSRGSIFY
jgi:hypothetical protein